MKKTFLLLVLSLFCSVAYCQKKKGAKKAGTSSSVLAKANNLTAEMVKNNFYLSINNKGAKKDTILLKKIVGDRPMEVKITPFTTKGTKLYSVSWAEKLVTTTKTKTEEATTSYTEIWDVAAKAKVLSNAQITTKIKEIQFLDKNKTVSQTNEKVRKEGFEFNLTKDGDVILKNKTH